MTKNPINIPQYYCNACNYKTANKKDFSKHTMTAKHQRMTSDDNERTEKSPLYKCCCGNEYKHRQGLHKHKKTCNYSIQSNENTTNTHSVTVDTNILTQILQENKEMREAMKEQQEQHNKQIQDLIPKLQQVTNINNTNSNNTTNNNKFNLNFFLNEQCKDAISIQTFIENLDIGIKELEHMGNVGYLQGMMTIMSNTLGAMDVYKRPVHCTDLKRETVYIKDGDTWKKDNANNDDLRRVINTVANVNYRNLDVWESQHPDAFESDTPDNIEYCKIAMESMGGYDNSDDKIAIKLNKLVKHVVREVYVK
jgi:hypothetical protein